MRTSNILIFAYYFQIEWRCAEKKEGLRVFVDDVEVPVTVGNSNHTHTDTLIKAFSVFV